AAVIVMAVVPMLAAGAAPGPGRTARTTVVAVARSVATVMITTWVMPVLVVTAVTGLMIRLAIMIRILTGTAAHRTTMAAAVMPRRISALMIRLTTVTRILTGTTTHRTTMAGAVMPRRISALMIRLTTVTRILTGTTTHRTTSTTAVMPRGIARPVMTRTMVTRPMMARTVITRPMVTRTVVTRPMVTRTVITRSVVAVVITAWVVPVMAVTGVGRLMVRLATVARILAGAAAHWATSTGAVVAVAGVRHRLLRYARLDTTIRRLLRYARLGIATHRLHRDVRLGRNLQPAAEVAAGSRTQARACGVPGAVRIHDLVLSSDPRGARMWICA